MDTSIAVIRLSGELEIGRAEEIAGVLRLAGDEPGVLLDFSEVSYADSSSLATLLRFRDDAAQRGVAVAMVIVSRQFARLIQFAGLGDAFAIFDTRAAALVALSQAGG